MAQRGWTLVGEVHLGPNSTLLGECCQDRAPGARGQEGRGGPSKKGEKKMRRGLVDNARKVIRHGGLEIGCISLQRRGPKAAPDAR